MRTVRRRLPTGIALVQLAVGGDCVAMVSPLVEPRMARLAKDIARALLAHRHLLVVVTIDELDEALKRARSGR